MVPELAAGIGGRHLKIFVKVVLSDLIAGGDLSGSTQDPKGRAHDLMVRAVLALIGGSGRMDGLLKP
jgi:hypothetical protein